MNFSDDDFGGEFRTDVGLMDMRTGVQFSDKMRMVFLQLPIFTKEASECESFFERWIYVLKNMDILDRMPWAAQYAAFQRLAEVCEVAALKPEERERYEESMKVYLDNIAIAQRAADEGEARGIAKGRAEVAVKMKSLGISPDVISASTGLSIDEINKL